MGVVKKIGKLCACVLSAGIFLSGILLVSCTAEKEPPPEPEEIVLARVGEAVITVKDFRRNYETGFGHLKTGPDRKRTYLEYMIKEKLLSLEGYRLGLDNANWIKESESKLLKEVLIEALIEKEVKSKITVSPGEIREAINKSKVSFKFRYWMEADPQKARAAVQAMREKGYAAVVEEKLYGSLERRINPKDLETGYLNYLQVPEEVLNAIQDLPPGDISDPLELSGHYYIFQVLDIRRAGVNEHEYINQASRFEQIIYRQKLEKELIRYGSNFMESKGVVTRGRAFKLLAGGLSEWKAMETDGHSNFQESLKQAATGQPRMKELKDNFAETFTVFHGGSLSVEEFLKEFDANKMRGTPPGGKDFLNALNSAVAITLRDYFLAKEALSLNLLQTPAVQNELTLWRNKWVYEETRRHFTEGIKIDEAISVLTETVEGLKARYPVEINQAVLDTIHVIDFRKSRWASLQIFRTGSNRLAYPIVDPAWGPEESNE